MTDQTESKVVAAHSQGVTNHYTIAYPEHPARTDDPLKGVKVPVSAAAPALSTAPDKFETAIAESASTLPLREDASLGYHHTPPQFKTGKDAVAYARQRYAQYARERTDQDKDKKTTAA